MAVGLVIVSHSRRLAEGVVELAEQMAHGNVRLIAAGGTEDGSIGTSLTKVTHGIFNADSGDGVVVLVDLGSAAFVAEMALEQLTTARRQRVRISNGPLVEGAVIAAVEAAVGAPLDQILATAESAKELDKLSKRS
jgi:dihydroxyacetone kinase phosphotransfer subunit